MPLFFALGMFCFTAEPASPLVAADYALRGTLLLLAAQPLAILFLFSQHAADTSGRWWLSALLFLLMFVALFGAVTGAVFVFAIDSRAPAFLGCMAAMVCSSLLLLIYGWAWNRSWFDALRLPRH